MAEPIEPENGQTAQYRRELDTYNKWLEQDISARFTMLSCMHNNMIREYEKYPTTKELWEVLKVAYGSTSATRLRALTLRFNQYVLDPKHSMIQHLDVMKDMIRELQNAGCELSDEQQVLAVLRESERAQQAAFVAHAGQRKPHKGKCWNKPTGAGPSNSQSQKQNLAPQGDKAMKRRRGKRGGKKNMAKAKCYNCQKMGHFARECTEPKKVRPNPSSPSSFVCSHAFLANSLLGWIVDIGATKHVTRDRAGFINYHRVPACSHYIVMGNGAQEEVLGIGSYQLKLSTGCELLLSDVQYAPNIRYNLLSITALMGQGFSFLFEQIGYVMYGEYPNKGMTEIESRDVDFLEEDFPSISEVKGNLELYELRDPQGGASITVEGETPRSYPIIDGDNESDLKLSGSCSLKEHNSQNPQMQRSKRGGIPCRRYEIEGESFMCASVDIDEPATYEEAVTSPNANSG
ncbi:UNVERIFIED_CONTAM: hypothetical protein Scaly_2917200 [Sesamum calycinum]|uniref:CCHC-type domain-containing protein n=1 Tax=Sesamum calycinum TaxID=2727403 RepID=A0AAW2KX69_9LAMI